MQESRLPRLGLASFFFFFWGGGVVFCSRVSGPSQDMCSVVPEFPKEHATLGTTGLRKASNFVIHVSRFMNGSGFVVHQQVTYQALNPKPNIQNLQRSTERA